MVYHHYVIIRIMANDYLMVVKFWILDKEYVLKENFIFLKIITQSLDWFYSLCLLNCLSFQEKFLRPCLLSYPEFLRRNTQEVMRNLTTTDPSYFLSLIELLQSNTCSILDFKKVDMMFKVSWLMETTWILKLFLEILSTIIKYQRFSRRKIYLKVLFYLPGIRIVNFAALIH